LKRKIFITKTEVHPIHHFAHRFASKKAKGKEELLENTDMHTSRAVYFHFRAGEGAFLVVFEVYKQARPRRAIINHVQITSGCQLYMSL